MPSKKLFLIDALALIYRAHFAFSKTPRINSKGQNTGAVFGFTNALLEIITKEKPTHIGVAFDTHAPTFRHIEFEAYKATRDEQPEDIRWAIPVIKEVIKGFQIPIIEMDGYEADDIIGTLALKAEKEGYTVFMMTPDKDYAQLVTENVFLYKPAYMGNDVEILGVQEVLQKFDIDKIEQVIDFLGLKGDSVDNIPGIPGIGDKTASKLLHEYGSIENMISRADEMSGSVQKKIKEFGEQGLFSKKLATIYTQVPVSFISKEYEWKQPEEALLRPILEELEFRTITKRLFGDAVSQPTTLQMDLFSNQPLPQSTALLPIRRIQLQEMEQFIFELKQEKSFSYFIWTEYLHPVDATIKAIAWTTSKNTTVYWPVSSEWKMAYSFLQQIFSQTIPKITYQLKQDIQLLKKWNVTIAPPYFDISLAHYLIDPETSHQFENLTQSLLGQTLRPIPVVETDEIPAIIGSYSAYIGQLKEKLEVEIKNKGHEKLLLEVEQPLSSVLAVMEFEGVAIDHETLQQMSSELTVDSLNMQNEILEACGQSFNIASPKQLGDVLFDKLKITPAPKKTKTGQYPTNEEILIKYAAEYPVIQKILDFRELQKLKSTYVDALPKLRSVWDGKIHTDYRQTVAATGRLSSNNPNLQNIPIRTPKGRAIRKAFVPSHSEFKILSADYSQIELRIMAAFSQDQSMMEAFQQGKDIHANTAAKVFGVSLSEVDGSMRRKAKEVNFGIIYGISAFGLSQNLNISRAEATEIIQSYFREFPGVKAYMDDCIRKAHELEYVETILGRRRYLRDINSKNMVQRNFAERNAINAPIQGSAADIIKVAMIHLNDWMTKEKLTSKMIMQVHDELIFEVAPDEKEMMMAQIPQLMKNALPLSVPMDVGIGIGANWLQAHE